MTIRHIHVKRLFAVFMVLTVCVMGLFACTSSAKEFKAADVDSDVRTNAGVDSNLAQSTNPIRKTTFLLDTLCSVTVYDASDEVSADAALALCGDYEKLFSRTIADSEVSKLNAAAGKPTVLLPETIALLEKARYYGDLSGGLFDVSIGAVSSLWDFSAVQPKIPDAKMIAAALPSVDYRKIVINGDTVRLENPATQIDLGGIAKGYIADRLADFLTAQGVKSAIIDLGGNIVTVGEKADGAAWHVGVRNPFSEGDGEGTNALIGSVEVKGGKSVGTSGIYERYFDLDGIRYHHIFDPKTGMPAVTDLVSVTAVTDAAVDGEGITTLCVLLGSERAQAFLEERNIQAVLIKDDGTVILTGDIVFT